MKIYGIFIMSIKANNKNNDKYLESIVTIILALQFSYFGEHS